MADWRKHYPAPWRYEYDKYAGEDCTCAGYRIIAANGEEVAVVDVGDCPEEAEHNCHHEPGDKCPEPTWYGGGCWQDWGPCNIQEALAAAICEAINKED